MMTEGPGGTITLLFTDIEGSSKLWERHPEAMARALARHNALLTEAFTTRGGYIFKTMGDAVYAAFATASPALAAALAAQHALEAEPWDEGGPLRVRMALHTGAVDQHGGDYFGPVLNRLSRLLSAAHGGQIILSVATEELVRDGLPAGVALRDLGEHRLKDLQRSERIFQVLATGLQAEFPPLITLDARTNNLPLQANPLIGRDDDIAAVCTLLHRQDVRLLTLTGTGGTGKTRLAIQVAAEMLEEFADGVFFVSLAPVSDSALVVPTIAGVLGLDEMGDQPLMATISDFLRHRQVLLLLDNFEHLLEANVIVANLIAAGPGVTVLATSRSVLQLSVEHTFAVPPLAVPAPDSLPDQVVLAQTPAVTLFVARAQAARADFTLTPANAAAVAELCRRLDGLPLAIELASARVRLLPPSAILSRLEDRLNLLTGGGRDRPTRQQTLRGTIQWSYDLLSEEECRLLRYLSIFAGGWTFESGDAVAGNALGLDLLEGLGALVDQSLVVAQEDPNGEVRFRMLETLREFGREQLRNQGEAAELEHRHAAYFLNLAEQLDLMSHGQHQPAWLAALDAEHDNLRAALAWGLAESNAGDESQRIEVGVRLGRALYWYWYLRSSINEGRAWLERARGRLNADSPPRLRALACLALGSVESFQGDLVAARAHLEESITILRHLHPEGDYNLAIALLGHGAAALNEGDNDTAKSSLEESAHMFRALGVPWLQSSALVLLGNTDFDAGDQTTARARYEEALVIQRSLGFALGHAQSLNNLGELARAEGDYERARSLYEESLAGFRESASKGDIARSLHNLGYVALMQGDDEQAAGRFMESLSMFQERGHKRGIAECLTGFAALAITSGAWLLAARLLGAAKAEFDSMGAAMWPADRLEYERTLTGAREALGETEFTSAWSQGQGLSLEQAVGLALEALVQQ